MKEQSSVEVVNALLSIFSRVALPKEIQCYQGSVFSSVLTAGFLEKCGIRLMNRVLQGAEEYAVPYLVDLAMYYNTWEDHLYHLSDVRRLTHAGLTAKPANCQLARAEVRYLGHVVSRAGGDLTS
ncbi:hypothetical protein HPB48_026965 [Haemaphysalis longicornis]|uniref:Uncharacterized protein n=1 Tax=Haemaphysalis longicornis TaxID=44386 RepID=A0A9J6HAT1_HAELO|nr:hypothetical protein HPB48_026965 [Haemaphysalis longicornis]